MGERAGTTVEGWPVLHLFYRIDRARWRAQTSNEREQAVLEFTDLLARFVAEEGLQFVPVAVLGKADLGLVAVHADLARLQRLEKQLVATVLGACLEPVHSYLSISEVSEYMSTTGDQARRLIDEEGLAPDSPEFQQKALAAARQMAAYAEARVHPRLPGADYPVFCFYPMSKARDGAANWYRLPFVERKRLMGSHAEAGRRFAGRVLQLITSSTGIDDWEWGVTLFCRDLKAVRDVVYEMRFDEGSAVFGLFGGFWVGLRFAPDGLRDALQL